MPWLEQHEQGAAVSQPDTLDTARDLVARAARALGIPISGNGGGPQLAPPVWVPVGRVEDGLGDDAFAGNTDSDRSSWISADLARSLVETFDPDSRRVNVIGGIPGVMGHHAPDDEPLARVTALDFDGLHLWAEVRQFVDPVLGLPRLGAAIARGFTGQSIRWWKKSQEVGGRPQLDHVAALAEGRQRGTAGFPYLDEIPELQLDEQQFAKLGAARAVPSWLNPAAFTATAAPDGLMEWRAASMEDRTMSDPTTKGGDAATPAEKPKAAPDAAPETPEASEKEERAAQPVLDAGALAAAVGAAVAEAMKPVTAELAQMRADQKSEAEQRAAKEREQAEERAKAESGQLARTIVETLARGGHIAHAHQEREMRALTGLPVESLRVLARTAAAAQPVERRVAEVITGDDGSSVEINYKELGVSKPSPESAQRLGFSLMEARASRAKETAHA